MECWIGRVRIESYSRQNKGENDYSKQDSLVLARLPVLEPVLLDIGPRLGQAMPMNSMNRLQPITVVDSCLPRLELPARLAEDWISILQNLNFSFLCLCF